MLILGQVQTGQVDKVYLWVEVRPLFDLLLKLVKELKTNPIRKHVFNISQPT